MTPAVQTASEYLAQHVYPTLEPVGVLSADFLRASLPAHFLSGHVFNL